MHGLISVLFCQSQSSEEQDQSDGERDTEKTWAGVRGINRVPSKRRKKRFSQHFVKISKKTTGLLSFPVAK